ncbi:alpha/beta hydrolase [Paenibacillus hamazuiensis]|uniref:alpha/beta hydrolase n=1 Tax=Paenibacillus hamazuiensis TaxID=2936508 RepID=UPI00200DDD9E|nr:alpha/beta fold hydrolase [Paenibacillus hamazuiensis]
MDSTSYQPASLSPATAEVVVARPASAKRRWLLIVIMSLLLLMTSLILAFHAYIAWTLARPHVDPLKSNPLKAIGTPYEDVVFPSANGKTEVSGWYIPGSTHKTVIFSHGYGANREEIWVPIYALAGALNKQGYNVLMFDYGFVHPELTVTGGIQESQELLGAIDFVKQREASKIFVWGFSMGAGTALQAALQTKDIDGMILDSTFILDPETLYHNMKQYVNLPKFPSLPLVKLFFPILNGVSLKQIPYQKVMETKYTMPIYFIHGQKDLKAPYEIVEDIYKNQVNPESQLWLLPNGEHEWIYQPNKRTYLNRTLGFLNELAAAPNLKLTQ